MQRSRQPGRSDHLSNLRMKTMEQRISLNVNGRKVDVRVADPAMPLLYALRNDLGLHGPRFGCGLSQCAEAWS